MQSGHARAFRTFGRKYHAVTDLDLDLPPIIWGVYLFHRFVYQTLPNLESTSCIH